eukprot:gene17841-24225_t
MHGRSSTQILNLTYSSTNLHPSTSRKNLSHALYSPQPNSPACSHHTRLRPTPTSELRLDPQPVPAHPSSSPTRPVSTLRVMQSLGHTGPSTESPSFAPPPALWQVPAGPGLHERTSLNENTRHHSRRRERQKTHIFSIIDSLPEPFGVASMYSYLPLDMWRDGGGGEGEGGAVVPVVDWSTMPPSLDPCAMLSAVNMSQKSGKSLKAQIEMFKYDGYLSMPASATTKKELAKVQEAIAALARPDNAFAGNRRGIQKRWQVESFAVILRRLVAHADSGRAMAENAKESATESARERPLRIVDFGCGTGGVLLPLAHLFPHCKFVGVEMKARALNIMQERVAAAGLTNVSCYSGMIEDYKDAFDIGLALHACGNATDLAMLLASKHRAAYIVSPCCVGKLKFSLNGGSSFSAKFRRWDVAKGTGRGELQQGVGVVGLGGGEEQGGSRNGLGGGEEQGGGGRWAGRRGGAGG